MKVLVATDIVSRGIDIDDIELVINYDVPRDVEDYIHRIGRTARANRKGRGLTFISEEDQERFYKVERFLDKVIDKLPMPEELGDGPEYAPKPKSKGPRRGRGGHRNRRGDHSSSLPHRNVRRGNPQERPVNEHKENERREGEGKTSSQHRRRPFHRNKKREENGNTQRRSDGAKEV